MHFVKIVQHWIHACHVTHARSYIWALDYNTLPYHQDYRRQSQKWTECPRAPQWIRHHPMFFSPRTHPVHTHAQIYLHKMIIILKFNAIRLGVLISHVIRHVPPGPIPGTKEHQFEAYRHADILCMVNFNQKFWFAVPMKLGIPKWIQILKLITRPLFSSRLKVLSWSTTLACMFAGMSWCRGTYLGCDSEGSKHARRGILQPIARRGWLGSISRLSCYQWCAQ